jgi:hypothetical protein
MQTEGTSASQTRIDQYVECRIKGSVLMRSGREPSAQRLGQVAHKSLLTSQNALAAAQNVVKCSQVLVHQSLHIGADRLILDDSSYG